MSRPVRVAIVSGGRSESFALSVRGAVDVDETLDPDRFAVTHVVLDCEHAWWHAPSAAVRALAQVSGRELSSLPDTEPVALEAGGVLRSLRTGEAVGGVDVVFPTIYGPYGEDGRLQGLLDLLGVACVGSGVSGSAVAMDKDLSKRVLRDAGIASPAWSTLRHGESPDADAVAAQLGWPVFVKPCRNGSSVAIRRVADAAGLEAAVADAFRYGTKVLVEAACTGRELRTALVGNEVVNCATTVGEVPLPAGAYYDYDTKLHQPVNRIPAAIDPGVSASVRELAVRAYRLLDLEGLARIDWYLEPDGSLLFGEANTLPCFSHGSTFRQLWAASGVADIALFAGLVELALKRRERDDAFAFTVSDATVAQLSGLLP